MTTRPARSSWLTARVAAMALLLVASLVPSVTAAAQDDASPTRGATIAVVAGNTRPPSADRPVVALLDRLGYTVEVVDDDEIDVEALAGVDLVLVSTSVVPSKVGARLNDLAVPILTWEAYLFDDLAMATRSGQTLRRTTSVRIDPTVGDHPLGGGHADSARVVVPAMSLNYGRPGPDAVVIAREAASTGRPVSFAYGRGARLVDQSRAPARRIALFPTYESVGRLTSDGWGLFVAAVEWALEAPSVDTWVTVLHANDARSSLVSVDPALPHFGGISRFATVLDELRHRATVGRRSPTQADGVRADITVSAGGNIGTGPEFVTALEAGAPYPDSAALGRLGFDAIAIGRADLAHGPDVLASLVEGQPDQVPYLSANLDVRRPSPLSDLRAAGRLTTSAVVNDRGVRIGITAVTSPDVPTLVDATGTAISEQITSAVGAEVERLTNRGADIVVLLSHLGSVEADAALVAGLSGVDAVVSGGGGELLSNPDDLLIPERGLRATAPYPFIARDAAGVSVPIVTTPGDYGYVGRLMLGFDPDGSLVAVDPGSGPVRVAGADHIDAVRPDPDLEREVLAPLRLALDAKAANRIAVSEVPLATTRTLLRLHETSVGNLIADSLLWRARRAADDLDVTWPELAIVPSGAIATTAIEPGPLTELDTFELLPDAALVTIVPEMSRIEVKQLLEHAVSRAAADDQLAGRDRFAQVAGVSFTWDPDRQAQVTEPTGEIAQVGNRVRYAELESGEVLVVDGRVVDGDDISVATLDTVATGAEGYHLRGEPVDVAVGVSAQAALADYVQLGLGGFVTLAAYPDGGQGRIVRLAEN